MGSLRRRATLHAAQTGRLKLEGSDPALRLDDCLLDQHDRDVVLHRIDSVTLLALQAFWLLAVFELLLAFRTNQNIEEFFGNHDCALYDIGRRPFGSEKSSRQLR